MNSPNLKSRKLRTVAGLLALLLLILLLGIVSLVAWTKYVLQTPTIQHTEVIRPFPIGVDTKRESITEDITVEEYMETELSIDVSTLKQARLTDKVLAELASFDWYQQLASSVSRILVIYPGQRKEEVVASFGDILKWTTEERELFSLYITEADPVLEDGKFFPGRLVVEYNATPEIVADALYENFSSEILARYDSTLEAQVPLDTALTIASLIEREAYDFTDMRYISGIIWNRLFIDMPLQLDASLQYARANLPTEPNWWPKIVPADKYIKSPYNTYQNEGLPPSPISNPSVEAVVAALNPRSTECMFYFHGPDSTFYCTNTYEEHVAKLREIYGQGS
jgi:cell division protein YceG involved in septum cleavage